MVPKKVRMVAPEKSYFFWFADRHTYRHSTNRILPRVAWKFEDGDGGRWKRLPLTTPMGHQLFQAGVMGNQEK
jgi:hypothetical protein